MAAIELGIDREDLETRTQQAKEALETQIKVAASKLLGTKNHAMR